MFLPSVQAQHWYTIKTFSGAGTQNYNTTDFNVPGTEWRISWVYSPFTILPNSTLFSFFVYSTDKPAQHVGSVAKTGSSQTSGTLSLSGIGDYYINVNAAYTLSWTIIVEYNMDSLPSMQPNYLMGAAFIAFIIIIIAVPIIVIILAIRRVRRRKSRSKLPPPPQSTPPTTTPQP